MNTAKNVPNRLINEKSPYLLQHACNPVDWFPWGDEAFEKARREDKPIFLSVGYSTCHWCHVMAHESFEHEEIAKILNRYFVSIKVDREERPDVDSVYMSVCQALTGSGGWPMSIFMTCEQKPFFAGTYFPPTSRYGMLGFRELILKIKDKWKKYKGELLKSAEDIVAHITAYTNISKHEDDNANTNISKHEDDNAHANISKHEDDNANTNISNNKDDNAHTNALDHKEDSTTAHTNEFGNIKLSEQAVSTLLQNFDKKHGGFGTAPKFPTPHNLLFLTLYAQISGDASAFEAVNKTLLQMRRGGIFDHIGYGFSRYSTDSYFLVPHFEKMLYDNALLIMAYTAAYSFSKEKIFLDTAEQTAEYVLREMTDTKGGFYSAQDADSDGDEGKFYAWNYYEILNIFGKEDGELFCEYYGITKQGNFEGKNIPNLLNGNDFTDEFEAQIQILYEYRKKRTRLHLDDKILTSWNALMICAMSMLYKVTGNKRYLQTAKDAQQFIENSLLEENTLYVSIRKGIRSGKGFLDDYAFYTAALIFLYEASAKKTYLIRAEQMCKEAIQQFLDQAGGYFLCGTENESLIIRPKETYDGAIPSGNSVMAYNLVRLLQLSGNESYEREVKSQLAFLLKETVNYPAGHSLFLLALLFYYHPPQKITVVLAKYDEIEAVKRQLPLYADVHILSAPTKEYNLLNERTTYYVCKNNTCLPPSNFFG